MKFYIRIVGETVSMRSVDRDIRCNYDTLPQAVGYTEKYLDRSGIKDAVVHIVDEFNVDYGHFTRSGSGSPLEQID